MAVRMSGKKSETEITRSETQQNIQYIHFFRFDFNFKINANFLHSIDDVFPSGYFVRRCSAFWRWVFNVVCQQARTHVEHINLNLRTQRGEVKLYTMMSKKKWLYIEKSHHYGTSWHLDLAAGKSLLLIQCIDRLDFILSWFPQQLSLPSTSRFCVAVSSVFFSFLWHSLGLPSNHYHCHIHLDCTVVRFADSNKA